MIISFFKENKTVLITSLIVAILFPTIVLTPSNYGFIPKDIGLQLVGYFGSILGGFLTLYGVWWTIKNENQKHIENLAIQYKPLVYAETDFSIIGFPSKLSLTLKLTNIGRGELLNGKITSCKPYSKNTLNCSYTDKNVFIPAGKSEQYNLQLDGLLIEEDNIELVLRFEYKDLYKFEKFVDIIIQITITNAIDIYTVCEHIKI